MSHGTTPRVAKLAFESTTLPLLRVGLAMSAGFVAAVDATSRRLIREVGVSTGGGAAAAAAASSDVESSGNGDIRLRFLEEPFVTFWNAGETLRDRHSEVTRSKPFHAVRFCASIVNWRRILFRLTPA